MSIGWGWGLDFVHGPTGAGENRITNNRILHTMTILKDGGAIYTQEVNRIQLSQVTMSMTSMATAKVLSRRREHALQCVWKCNYKRYRVLAVYVVPSQCDLNVHDNYTDSNRLSNGNPHNIVATITQA